MHSQRGEQVSRRRTEVTPSCRRRRTVQGVMCGHQGGGKVKKRGGRVRVVRGESKKRVRKSAMVRCGGSVTTHLFSYFECSRILPTSDSLRAVCLGSAVQWSAQTVRGRPSFSFPLALRSFWTLVTPRRRRRRQCLESFPSLAHGLPVEGFLPVRSPLTSAGRIAQIEPSRIVVNRTSTLV